MNLKHLSNDQLHLQTKAVAEKERLTTIEVLWHLREIERRMLYALRGYRDLKEYCVKELKYSEGSAWRRISAMKLLVELPSVEEKIQTGALNLTQISMARAHFREVKAQTVEKHQILSDLENQSTRFTERLLAEKKPGLATNDNQKVCERPLRGQRLEVTLIFDVELQNDLEEIQILLGKPHSKLELVKLMTSQMLAHLKKTKTQSATSAESCAGAVHRTSAGPGPNMKPFSRAIPRTTRQTLVHRDQHQCQFRDTKTGRQCEARFHLQAEHVLPYADGGTHDLNNLQLLCPSHNRLRAAMHFGRKHMAKYLPALK